MDFWFYSDFAGDSFIWCEAGAEIEKSSCGCIFFSLSFINLVKAVFKIGSQKSTTKVFASTVPTFIRCSNVFGRIFVHSSISKFSEFVSFSSKHKHVRTHFILKTWILLIRRTAKQCNSNRAPTSTMKWIQYAIESRPWWKSHLNRMTIMTFAHTWWSFWMQSNRERFIRSISISIHMINKFHSVHSVVCCMQ